MMSILIFMEKEKIKENHFEFDIKRSKIIPKKKEENVFLKTLKMRLEKEERKLLGLNELKKQL